LRLSEDAETILAGTRIGMLSLHAGRQPLVNPAAFHYGDGSVWMTTSRYAAKLALARRDPRAGFLVGLGTTSVLLLGTLESFDPFSVGGQLRAAMQGPAFYANLAAYAVKNAAFVGGYLVDLARIPRGWWPQNRVVMRLRAHRALTLQADPAPALEAARLPGVTARLAKALGKVGPGYACWVQGGYPVLAPVQWNAEEDMAWAVTPDDALGPPARPLPGALVIESHHRFRATRMLGACLRGTLTATDSGRREVQARYGSIAAGGYGLKLEVERVTSWSGFEVTTRSVVTAQQPAAAS
jgi:hypothetical protein